MRAFVLLTTELDPQANAAYWFFLSDEQDPMEAAKVIAATEDVSVDQVLANLFSVPCSVENTNRFFNKPADYETWQELADAVVEAGIPASITHSLRDVFEAPF